MIKLEIIITKEEIRIYAPDGVYYTTKGIEGIELAILMIRDIELAIRMIRDFAGENPDKDKSE